MRKGDPLGIVQVIKILTYKQMVYIQPRIYAEKWDTQNSRGFWDTDGLPELDQTTWPNDSQQKKRTCWIVDFTVSADHGVKESKKRDKYLDLARELKKLGKKKVAVIPIVIGVLGIVTKGLV